MVKVVSIKENELIFNGIPLVQIGMNRFCEPFKINLDSVKIIALSPHFSRDEDYLYIHLVDNNMTHFLMPEEIVDELSAENFEEFFGLKSLRTYCVKYESVQQSYLKTDKVIFPKELFWKDLYKRNWLWMLRIVLKGFPTNKGVFGHIAKEILE